MKNVKYFECTICHKQFPKEQELMTCPECGEKGILEIIFDYNKIRRIANLDYFKNNKDMVWKEFAEDVEGEFIEKDGFRPSKVIVRNENWNIIFDTYSVSDGRGNTTYTRVRVPFVKKMDFYMDIHEKGIFKLLKLLILSGKVISKSMFCTPFSINSNIVLLYASSSLPFKK